MFFSFSEAIDGGGACASWSDRRSVGRSSKSKRKLRYDAKVQVATLLAASLFVLPEQLQPGGGVSAQRSPSPTRHQRAPRGHVSHTRTNSC